MDLIFLAVVYLLTSFIIAIMASKRNLSWLRALLLSLLLTPLAGALYLNNTSHVQVWYEDRYRCPRCDFSFTEPMDECPHCLSDGYHVKLNKTVAKMT